MTETRHNATDDLSPLLLHFEGPWSDEDKQIIRQAVRDVEADSLPPIHPELGTGWIFTYIEADGVSVYSATRQGLQKGFKGLSVQELAEDIRNAASDAA